MVSNNRLGSIWNLLARNTRYARYVESRDLRSFERRYTAEGLAFAARELGKLRSHTLAALERGRWEAVGKVARFGRKTGSVLPRFLYGAFSRIFTDQGELLYDYDVDAVDCVNCLTAVFTKIDGAHTPESEDAVVQGFIENERELRLFEIKYQQNLVHGNVSIPTWKSGDMTLTYGLGFRQVIDGAKLLLRELLGGSDPTNISPNAGSGASACGVPPHERWSMPRMVEKIDRLWPYEKYWTCGVAHLKSAPQLWSGTLNVPRAKVLLVPKDCRGPRLISCEPRETMWVQQGLMRKLVSVCERHRLTRGEVNFTDQMINWHVARIASATFTHSGIPQHGEHLIQSAAYLQNRLGSRRRTHVGTSSASEHSRYPGMDFQDYATLDLKDASDRVSLSLVKELFPARWVEALLAARSEETTLPNGKVIRLYKHAPMGSATCFPVMALCIWSIAKAVITHGQADRKERVFVYGDDVIVPAPFATGVKDALEMAGLLVNHSKSFVHGPFKESCGGEFVDTFDVTPIRLRQMPQDDDESRYRTIAFVNNHAKKFGCYDTERLRNLVRTWYPNIPEKEMSEIITADEDIIHSSAYAGVFDVDYRVPMNDGIRRRWNSHLQRREFRVRLPDVLTVKYPTDNWSGLFRSLVKPGHELGLAALPKRCRYKYRWVHWRG